MSDGKLEVEKSTWGCTIGMTVVEQKLCIGINPKPRKQVLLDQSPSHL